jgi:hypothetical protein
MYPKGYGYLSIISFNKNVCNPSMESHSPGGLTRVEGAG